MSCLFPGGETKLLVQSTGKKLKKRKEISTDPTQMVLKTAGKFRGVERVIR
jgi:hypothetical protein